MENLRWILLLAGIVFVVVVYIVSRQRRRNREDQSLPLQDELPEFSATDNLDHVDEGVGKVRIIARFDDTADVGDIAADADAAQAVIAAEPFAETADYTGHGDDQPGEMKASSVSQSSDSVSSASSDIFTLYILSPSRQEPFTGDQINSAARASGLVFGEMNIFHRLDGADRIQFSLANMLKPGSFDADKLFDTETTGVTLFMQAGLVDEPQVVLDDMLQTAYQMSEMLGGRLCNHQREPLTEQDTNRYREQIAGFIASA